MSDSLRDRDSYKAASAALLSRFISWLRLQRRPAVYRRALVKRLRTRFVVSLTLSASYARANMFYFALLEIIGQPLYDYIWSDVYPQQYENCWLRLICIGLALPMLFESRITRFRNSEAWLIAYWLFSLLFQLPFFFFFMTFKNDLSAVWALSSLAALMLMVILVFDWLMTILLAATGVLLAWLAFIATGGELHPVGQIPLMVLLFTYLFGILVGSAINYKSELVAREKLGAITDAMGTMAHELRTPLLGIRSGARGLHTYLPSIIEGYEMARSHNLPVKPIRQAHFHQIQSVLERITTESEYTSVVLDMLLVNANRASIDQSRFKSISVADCIHNALERYPFHSERQRQWIDSEKVLDFTFLGSKLLMVHVLFNLIKNALYHISRTDAGRIMIWTTRRPSSGENRLHFRDTGPGIQPDRLPRIFERFYSGMPRGQGTGIGLAFVHRVVDSFDGRITCDSIMGQYTEFTITLPEFDHDDHT